MIPVARTQGPEAQLRALGFRVYFQTLMNGRTGLVCRRAADESDLMGASLRHTSEARGACMTFLDSYVARAIA